MSDGIGKVELTIQSTLALAMSKERRLLTQIDHRGGLSTQIRTDTMTTRVNLRVLASTRSRESAAYFKHVLIGINSFSVKLT
jgi:hypothetical protein